MTIDASNVTVTTTAVEGSNLVTRDANGNVISSTPLPPETVNSNALLAKVLDAIDANVAWLDAHPTRQAVIDKAVSDATAGKTATVTNIAQAQAAVRQLADLALRLAQGLDAAEARLVAVTRQVTAIERQIAGRLDATTGT